MKACKKLFAVMLSVCMVAAMLTTTAFAGTANISLEVVNTEVAVGEEFDVAINNTDMSVLGFGVMLIFNTDELECVSITGAKSGKNAGKPYVMDVDEESLVAATAYDLVADTSDGIYSAAWANAVDANYEAGWIVTLRFKALKTCTATITLEENTNSDSGYGFVGVADTAEITIGGEEPEHECTFGEWVYDDEQHWKECTDPECDLTTEKVAHEFGEWEVTTQPQVGVAGEATRECGVCGKPETKPVDPLPETGGGTGGSTTGGSTTGGSTTGGSTTGGSTTGGSTTGGSTTGGSTTGGSTTGGSTTGGSTTGGSTTGGSTTGGSTTGGSTTGGGETGGETTGGASSVITPSNPSNPSTGEATVGGSKFVDIKGHWCADLIEKWADLGVIEGLGDGKFNPDGLLTRAQAAAIFTRWLGLEATADISFFADVKVGDWYYDYVAKCYAAGIVKGKAADQFAPNDYITRAEMFTMLCRALNIEGQTTLIKNFTDADQIPAWAFEYTAALVNNGYVSGMTETTLAPLGNVTRAQMVKLMDNLEGLVK